MNLGELKTALKRYGFDDTDPLATWLNAAQYDFLRGIRWPFTKITDDFTVPAYDGDISPFVELPVECKAVHVVYNHTDEASLDYFSQQEFTEAVLQSGTPQYYTLFTISPSWRLYVYPFNVAETVLEVTYHAGVAPMSGDSDVPGLPVDYHYSIVRGAAAIALEAENEEDRARTAREAFETDIAKALDENITPQTGTTLQVTDAMGYFES